MWRRRFDISVAVRAAPRRYCVKRGQQSENRAPTHRAAVGYRSRDLSAPSYTDGGEAAAMTTGRRAAFRKSMWGKKGQEKSKDPWLALNKGKVFSFQSNKNHQTTLTSTALTSRQVHMKWRFVTTSVTFGSVQSFLSSPRLSAPTLRLNTERNQTYEPRGHIVNKWNQLVKAIIILLYYYTILLLHNPYSSSSSRGGKKPGNILI